MCSCFHSCMHAVTVCCCVVVAVVVSVCVGRGARWWWEVRGYSLKPQGSSLPQQPCRLSVQLNPPAQTAPSSGIIELGAEIQTQTGLVHTSWSGTPHARVTPRCDASNITLQPPHTLEQTHGRRRGWKTCPGSFYLKCTLHVWFTVWFRDLCSFIRPLYHLG